MLGRMKKLVLLVVSLVACAHAVESHTMTEVRPAPSVPNPDLDKIDAGANKPDMEVKFHNDETPTSKTDPYICREYEENKLVCAPFGDVMKELILQAKLKFCPDQLANPKGEKSDL